VRCAGSGAARARTRGTAAADSARAEQSYEQLSRKALNIKFPPAAGLTIPPTSGAFGYSEAIIRAEAPVLNLHLLDLYRQQKSAEAASLLSTQGMLETSLFLQSGKPTSKLSQARRVETRLTLH
jgi:hypothetical protein